MFRVETLKSYLCTLSKKEFMKLADKIYDTTKFLEYDYPQHKKWYYEKQLPRIESYERNILFVKNPDHQEEIIGVIMLKKTKKERKICSIYVVEEFRNMGIGTMLLEEAFKWLSTTKPLITIKENKKNYFDTIIKRYNWDLCERIEGLYNETAELIFNGHINIVELEDTTLYRKITRKVEKK